MKRASETAQCVNYLKREISYDKGLRELNFGIFEGLTYEEIQKNIQKSVKKVQKIGRNIIF